MARNNQPTNEEQKMLRQSAPRPSANSIFRDSQDIMPTDRAILDGIMTKPIGKEFLHELTLTLQKYKEGKANLENRIVQNEQWYKLRHWEQLRKTRNDRVEPTSAWLFNSLENKLADAMDNFPSPNILPREEGDKAQAKMLSSIVPVILEQNEFEQTYEDEQNYKFKSGTGAYGVFWDAKKNNIGDINIVKADILNLFWESGVTDIQKSRYFFSVELVDNKQLEMMYPQLQNRLSTSTVAVSKYIYDDSVDTTEKSAVIDAYYKKFNAQGKQILHYVKYVNDEVLFATENEPEYADRGLYDHGQYPFVLDPLFKVEGTPAGFGYVDVAKSAQEYIDRANQAFMENLIANARTRHFIRNDGAINEKEYADYTKDFVHTDGQLGQDSIMPIVERTLPEVYVNLLNGKIDELKETTGNRDVSTGGTSGGVTAASSIAALQEAGSKLSRLSNKASYRAFRKVVLMVIELMRQFYDLPRYFRILGERGAEEFVQFDNSGIVAQALYGIDGQYLGDRIPLFDVQVSAQKQSPYSKMSQNELALSFYNAGFFNPQLADQALACLDMMDFDRKDMVAQKIAQNGMMFNQILQMQQQMMALGGMVDASRGGNEITASLAAQFGMDAPDNAQLGGNAKAPEEESVGESNYTKKARQRTAEATAPN